MPDTNLFLVRARPPSDFVHTSECRHAYDPVEMRWRWADENPTVDWKAKYPRLKACRWCDPPSPLRAEASA